MAYDEALAARIRKEVAGEPGVSEKRMFGGLAFLVNGNMAVSASGNGGVMLRCDPTQTSALISGGEAERVVMRGRAMDGWLRVQPAALSSAGDFSRWVRVGVDYARALPPKRG